MKLPNKIGGFKLTRGTETSQYPEERKSTETPLVVASERGPAQSPSVKNPKALERATEVGDSPVGVDSGWGSSKAGHVKSCLKMGGPPSKAKYSLVTDSEQVP
jgi:hypothetical protein